MKRMGRGIAGTFMILAIMGLAMDNDHEERLTVELHPARGKGPEIARPCVEFNIVNTSNTPVVYARTIAPRDRFDFPDTVLEFMVTDARGIHHKWQGDKYESSITNGVVRMKPTIDDFETLLPGDSSSTLICLDRGIFDYGVSEPGEYSIRAVVHFGTFSWFIKASNPTMIAHTKEWLRSHREELAEGKAETNAAAVTYPPLASHEK